MYSEKIKTYSDIFPNEIKRSIKGLGNEVRYAILAYLLKKKKPVLVILQRNYVSITALSGHMSRS